MPDAIAPDPQKTHVAKEFAAPSPLLACRFDRQGKYAFATAQDFSIYRWRLEDGQQTALKAHDSWARTLVFLHDGATLVSGGYDGRLIWWELGAEAPQPIRKLDDAHAGWIRAAALSPDGALLATCGNDNLIKLWTPEGQPVRTLAGHTRHVYNVAFHPSGAALASFDLMGKIKHWEVATGKELREFDAAKMHKYDTTFGADIGGARAMRFHPDGKTLACGGITNVSNAFAGVGNVAVMLADWEAGKEQKLLVSSGNVQGTIWGLVWHPAGFWIGSCAGSGGKLFFWKPDGEKEFFVFNLPSEGRDLDLHPDGLTLLSCHFDKKARLYRMAEKAK